MSCEWTELFEEEGGVLLMGYDGVGRWGERTL